MLRVFLVVFGHICLPQDDYMIEKYEYIVVGMDFDGQKLVEEVKNKF